MKILDKFMLNRLLAIISSFIIAIIKIINSNIKPIDDTQKKKRPLRDKLRKIIDGK